MPLSNPGVFIFLHYPDREAACLTDVDPEKGYSRFSLLLLNLGGIFRGVSSISKACRTGEISLPASAGLVATQCSDSLLNGLAEISESALLRLRRYLTKTAKSNDPIEGKKIAFDFKIRDFTGDDIALKISARVLPRNARSVFADFAPALPGMRKPERRLRSNSETAGRGRPRQ